MVGKGGWEDNSYRWVGCSVVRCAAQTPESQVKKTKTKIQMTEANLSLDGILFLDFGGGGQKIYIQRGLGGWGSASYVIIIWRDIRVGLGECNLPPPIKKSNVFHLGQNLLSLSDIILSSGFVSLDRLID